LTASRPHYRAHFGPLLPGVYHAPYGDAEYIEKTLFRHLLAPEEVAAIFVEPILGEGGYVVPPPQFLPELQEICRRHGILLVADEVQTGFGRTGKMFACEHWGVEPDILCVAKGIASGLPLGAMVAREEVSTWTAGTHGSTFGGNPVACAAALATIELLGKGLVKNAARVGGYLKQRLDELKSALPVIKEVRGLGLMIGVELSGDKSAKASGELRETAVQRAFENGLLLLACGQSAVRFSPPLIVDQSAAHTAVEIFAATLKELTP
jgi:4-aminobutyrate aminotransferase